MFAHARAELPNEACGILAGKDGQAIHFYPATNTERSPTRYSIDSEEQLRILKEVEAKNWDLLGIFHSHTHTGAYPSSTDVSRALDEHGQPNWPGTLYVIASLQHDPPVLRAFQITGRDGVTEEDISYLG